MESCTEFVLVKTPKQARKVETDQPDEVATLRKKFQQKLLETKRKLQMDEFEKLRSQSTSIIRSYQQTHRKTDIKFPFLGENPDTFIQTMKEKIGSVLGPSPVKQRPKKNLETLMPVSLPKPVYDILLGLKVKPPEPKDKFYELIETPPFNRGKSQQLIVHFLKQYKFLRMHPDEILKNISSKVTFQKAMPFPPRSIWIVEHGVLTVNGTKYKQGQLANPQILEHGVYEFAGQCECSPDCRVMTIPKYDYQSFLTLYVSSKQQELSELVRQSATVKMLTNHTIEKLTANMTCRFINAGEYIYRVGDKIDGIYITATGRAFRKVIVELDQSNRIPVSHKQSLVKTFSKSYQFKINFQVGEVFGYNEIINGEQVRTESIQTEEECMFLCVNVNAFRDVLDEHTTDILRDEKNKKYPADYDKLCAKFAHEKESFRRMEMIKVEALQQGCRYGSRDEVEKRSKRIERYVSKSMRKISDYDRLSLIKSRKTETLVRNRIS